MPHTSAHSADPTGVAKNDVAAATVGGGSAGGRTAAGITGTPTASASPRGARASDDDDAVSLPINDSASHLDLDGQLL
jgi:hypothetical protein